jgi:hypothetical protein
MRNSSCDEQKDQRPGTCSCCTDLESRQLQPLTLQRQQRRGPAEPNWQSRRWQPRRCGERIANSAIPLGRHLAFGFSREDAEFSSCLFVSDGWWASLMSLWERRPRLPNDAIRSTSECCHTSANGRRHLSAQDEYFRLFFNKRRPSFCLMAIAAIQGELLCRLQSTPSPGTRRSCSRTRDGAVALCHAECASKRSEATSVCRDPIPLAFCQGRKPILKQLTKY